MEEYLSMNFGSEWKEIKGFPRYYVSRDGRVYSTITEKMLVPSEPCHQVTFTKDGKKHPTKVAKLVYEAFIGHVRPYQMLGYADGDSANCSASNLLLLENVGELVHQESVQEKKKDTFAKKYGTIYAYGPDGEVLKSRTIREMVEQLHNYIGRTSIGDCIAGKREKAKGWSFERIKEEEEEE